jgi:hypothetical protein
VPRVGLVRFATVALEAARAVVPDYRLPRSKHTFTQPQLLAVLCLMRYDDWTFRDAETRLAEHRELRRALRLRRVPDHTTLWRFLDRLPLAVLQDLLAEVLRRCGGTPPPGRGGGRRRRATVAIDATGLATGSVSTFFVRRLAELKGQGRERAWWLKWLVVLDVDRQLILGQTAHRGPRRDSAAVRALLAHAPGVQTLAHAHALAWVVGDKEFDSEANHAFIHDALHAASAIPLTRGGQPRAPYRAALAARGLPAVYRRRVLIESVFSAIKRTQGGVAPGRRVTHQVKQAHLVGISYDLARLEQLRTAA